MIKAIFAAVFVVLLPFSASAKTYTFTATLMDITYYDVYFDEEPYSQVDHNKPLSVSAVPSWFGGNLGESVFGKISLTRNSEICTLGPMNCSLGSDNYFEYDNGIRFSKPGDIYRFDFLNMIGYLGTDGGNAFSDLGINYYAANGFDAYWDLTDVNIVPLPAGGLLLLTGLGAIGLKRRRLTIRGSDDRGPRRRRQGNE